MAHLFKQLSIFLAGSSALLSTVAFAQRTERQAPDRMFSLKAGPATEELMRKELEPPPPPPAPVVILSAQRKSLHALDHLPPLKAYVADTNITEHAIYLINPETQLDEEEDVEAFVEKIKVNDLVEESRTMNRNGEVREAIEMLEESLSTLKTPDGLFEVHHQIGILLFSLNLHQEAAEHLENAITHKADSASVSCNLAAIYLSMGEVDKALTSLSRVETTRLFESNQRQLLFSTYFNYACAYSLKNMLEECLANIELSARFDPQRTLSSMGDPQLDNVRKSQRFNEIKGKLIATITK